MAHPTYTSSHTLLRDHPRELTRPCTPTPLHWRLSRTNSGLSVGNSEALTLQQEGGGSYGHPVSESHTSCKQRQQGANVTNNHSSRTKTEQLDRSGAWHELILAQAQNKR
uniref:Uncharacterized protein n=1 Tax=Knipowitschia caucasica TaxID=637954 RepID=A0AAV2KE59_KNICA